MDPEAQRVAPQGVEVSMLAPEIVRQIRGLADLKWGSKRIADATGVARGTVRRYLRGGPAAEVQKRPTAWTLDDAARALAVELLDGPAQGNAVVVRRLLVERGIPVPLRTLQRALMPHRRARLAAEVATVRFETAPGHQMQIDFGEKLVTVGAAPHTRLGCGTLNARSPHRPDRLLREAEAPHRRRARHRHVLVVQGESYRLKQKKRAGHVARCL